MTAASSRRATATDRTISLFDGKTDSERGSVSRDGSLAQLTSTSRGKRRLIWDGGVTRWWTPKEVFEVELVGTSYVARKIGKVIGTYATIIEAGRACEAAR